MASPRRWAVVTGSNCGIGLRTAQLLVSGGATWPVHNVIVTARDDDKVVEAVLAAKADHGVMLELGDMDSVRRAAASIRKIVGADGISVLILNAGAAKFGGPRAETLDGFEMHFGCNHLGHFLLASLLLPCLRATPGSRVVVVSSGLHDPAKQPSDGNAPLAPVVDLEDLMLQRGAYSGNFAYGVSKLCNVLFAYEFTRRMSGQGVVANATNPGFIPASELIRNAGKERITKMRSLPPQAVRSLDDGALCSILAATSSAAAAGGGYYELNRQGQLEAVRSSEASYDQATAAKLWKASAQLVELDRERPHRLNVTVGALLVLGGCMGFIKKRSMPSLIGGTVSGALLIRAGLLASEGVRLGAIVSAVLAAVMGGRVARGAGMMPAGLVGILGFVSFLYNSSQYRRLGLHSRV